MTKTATFRIDGKVLTGSEAKTAWAAQSAKCACGSYGDTAHAISGTCEDSPAKWLGCANCSGQAVGGPLIYRTAAQIKGGHSKAH